MINVESLVNTSLKNEIDTYKYASTFNPIFKKIRTRKVIHKEFYKELQNSLLKLSLPYELYTNLIRKISLGGLIYIKLYMFVRTRNYTRTS